MDKELFCIGNHSMATQINFSKYYVIFANGKTVSIYRQQEVEIHISSDDFQKWEIEKKKMILTFYLFVCVIYTFCSFNMGGNMSTTLYNIYF